MAAGRLPADEAGGLDAVLGLHGEQVGAGAEGCNIEADAVRLIRRALEGGMYYFDTARFYTDSEAKLGVALEGRRADVVISTKTGATTAPSVSAVRGPRCGYTVLVRNRQSQRCRHL